MATLSALLAAAFSSCKSKDSKPAAGLAAIFPTTASNGNSGTTFSGDNGGRAVSSVEGPGGTTFHFEPLDGDDSPDRKGAEAYELGVEEKEDEVHLTIRANTSAQYDWKYVLGYIYYDAESYNPAKYVPGDMFGEEDKAGEDYVTTAIFKEKGKAAFWHGLLNWDEKDATHGGLVGTFVFKKEPWDPGRDASRAPDGNANKVFWKFQWHASQKEPYIYWSEVNRGDGDLNGEVGIPDQTPLALHHLEPAPHPSLVDAIDYNDDQVIDNLTDHVVILNNYLNTITKYRIKMTHTSGDIRVIWAFAPALQVRYSIYNQNFADNPEIITPAPLIHFKSEYGAVGYFRMLYYEDNGLRVDYYGNEIWKGSYAVTITPFDHSIVGVESDPFEIVLDQGFTARPSPGTHDLIFLSEGTGWRYNDMEPTPELDNPSNVGTTIMQYISNGQPIPGITLHASIKNTSATFHQFNAVRLLIDIEEIESAETYVSPADVFDFSRVSYIPYDGKTSSSGFPSHVLWEYYNSAWHPIPIPDLGPTPRASGFLDPITDGTLFPPLIVLGEVDKNDNSLSKLYFVDIGYNWGGSTTYVPPFSGTARIFDVFLPYKNDPVDIDYMNVGFSMYRPNEIHDRSFYTNAQSVIVDFQGIEGFRPIYFDPVQDE